MSQTLVYGLVDPRTKLVRYVGKSSSGMHRPRAHANPSKLRGDGHKERWIRSLQHVGLTYDVAVLEEAEPHTLIETECWWIAYGRACGWPLTNATDGGEGLAGFQHTTETRRKMALAATGRVMARAVVERVAQQLRGRKQDPAIVAARAAKQRGSKRSAATRDKLSLRATVRELRRAAIRSLPLICCELVAQSLTDEQWARMCEARAKKAR